MFRFCPVFTVADRRYSLKKRILSVRNELLEGELRDVIAIALIGILYKADFFEGTYYKFRTQLFYKYLTY